MIGFVAKHFNAIVYDANIACKYNSTRNFGLIHIDEIGVFNDDFFLFLINYLLTAFF